MKKFTHHTAFFTMLALVFGMVFTLTSCRDEAIANTLEGTWEGNMYVSSIWNGQTYDATYTEVEFLLDPFRFTKGSGYWVDYYNGTPWKYIANHISWRVDNGIITIYFEEEGTSIMIEHYRLSDNRFTGEIVSGNTVTDFSLVHTSSPNWNDYGWGYDYWDDYYYTRSGNDSTTVAKERPHRIIRSK